jgi:hypothetical protein
MTHVQLLFTEHGNSSMPPETMQVPNTCSIIRLLLFLALPGGLYSAPVLAAGSVEAPVYPRVENLPGGKVSIHHPVVTDWQDFEVLSARVPVEITPAGSSDTWVGTVQVEADTEVHFEDRVVGLSGLSLARATPESGLSASALALQKRPATEKLLIEALSDGRQSVSLEYLIRSLPEDFAEKISARASPGLSFDPPRIIISYRPMQLMLIDGPPSTALIDGVDLEYVVNTNWNVYHHKTSDTWYIPGSQSWLENSTLSGGDWLVATELPEDFSTLALNSSWAWLNEMIPPRAPDQPPLPITISYEPAELVVIEGKAQLASLPGTNLQYVINTQQDLFMLDDRYYLLLSGRWFTTKNLKRKWTNARQLPGEFASIPADHEKAHVRVAVPGTEEARVALIETAIPRKKLLAVNAGGELKVKYAGEPEFVNIQGTPLGRAVNTPHQVIRHNNFYYLCEDGAWYLASAPTGPWVVATELPEAIYDIPPTDPAYNVTFVRLNKFDDSSGEVAYSFTGGYGRNYINGAAVVHGTGYYHRGSVYYRGGYPVYGRYPPSYGYGAWYRPAYGRYGYRGYYDPYPRSTSVTLNTNVPEKDWEWDLNGNKKTIYDQGARNYVGSGGYNMNGAMPYNSSQVQGSAEMANLGEDDLYSDSDGVIYRKSSDTWERYQQGQWQAVGNQVPADILRQYQARHQAYRNYDKFNSEQVRQSPPGN